jgi:hypothetical protein
MEREDKRTRGEGRGERGGRGGGRGGRRGGRGFGRPGGWQQADLPSTDDAAAWLTGRLPDGWFTGPPEISIDRDEIVVVGALTPPTDTPSDPEAATAAAAGRISRFREDTRTERMQIADEAEARYARTLSWGASIGDTREVFTHLAAPAMTRLRQDQRRVLDTLVDSGVARSRSEALAWCVQLVGEHADAWLGELRTAMAEVDKLRSTGPSL